MESNNNEMDEDISDVNENWYQEQMKLVDSCLCGHEFHGFVQEQLIAFLTNPNTAWNGQQLNRATISAFCHPLVQQRHHSVRYRRSTMQFLLGFQRHVRSLERGVNSEILLKLISQAIASLLCSTRRQSAAYTLPDACLFAETIDYRHFAEWPHWTSSVEESDPDWTTPGQPLLASLSQSHRNFGDTAGMQCVAMSAMAIRFHHLMLGSLINLSRTTLDAILYAGNDLYNVCVRWQQYRYLNFDELEAGMEEFDRQGWPQFSRELGPDSWDRFALDVGKGFNNGYDGFLMIMNNKAVAVMRDRDHPTQLYLFDSHGSEIFSEIRQSTDGIVAYMQRVNGLNELVMSLQFLFGEFHLCEIHMYKCHE